LSVSIISILALLVKRDLKSESVGYFPLKRARSKSSVLTDTADKRVCFTSYPKVMLKKEAPLTTFLQKLLLSLQRLTLDLHPFGLFLDTSLFSFFFRITKREKIFKRR
jgi:hypothetical protein